MTLTLTCVVTATLIALYNFYKFLDKRRQLETEFLKTLNKYNYYKTPIIFMIVFIIIGLSYVLYGYKVQDNNNMLIGLAIAVVGLIEILYFRFAFIFYYGSNKCIIDNTLVNYNQIKTIVNDKKGIFAKGKVTLFNGKEYLLFHECCDIINKQMNK